METRWTKNPSRWELEWGIKKIRGGLKNQPHRFGGDFEKPPEPYCKSLISNKNNQQNMYMYMTLINIIFLSLRDAY